MKRTRTRTNHVTAANCPHCDREMAINTMLRHLKRCFDNPEYRAHLHAIVPAGIGSAEYSRLQPTLDNAPAGGTILARFGTFADFMAWLHSDPLPARYAARNEARDATPPVRISQQRQPPHDGLTVFDQPRRTWQAGGRTFVSWGVR